MKEVLAVVQSVFLAPNVELEVAVVAPLSLRVNPVGALVERVLLVV